MEFTKSRKVKTPLPVRVVLVKPLYSMNVGMTARVMKNFSVVDLALVQPQCAIDLEAVKYAKHSKEVLDKAKKYASVTEAVKGFDLVIGTTGVVRRFTNNLKTCVALNELKLPVNKKIALVFGSEGIGLNEQELEQCDVITHIPAEEAHPVLNLSHSVAVVLYALFFTTREKPLYKFAKKKEVDYLYGLFVQIVDKLELTTRPVLRDPHKAKIAFKRVFARSRASDKEVNVLSGVFARIKKLIFQEEK